MTVHIAINGFGRIGRTVLRTLLLSGREDLQVVAINDPSDAGTLAHLFEYDSLHGTFPHKVVLDHGDLTIGKHTIRMSQQTAPEDLDWLDVDVVLECSGHFTASDQALRHLKNGSTKILLGAPSKGNVKTVVYGVNQSTITASDQLISNGSCTTNCLVPVAQVLDKSFGIVRGMMTTVHCYTRSQSVHDGPHDELYRARAAALSMVPTSSGAAVALGRVLPHLAGKVTGQAIRVPTPNISCIDLTVEISSPVTEEIVNAAFREAESGGLNGILQTTDKKLVSIDFRQNTNSAIVALDQTRVQSETLVRVLAWYDNEWGFAHRLLDMAACMARA